MRVPPPAPHRVRIDSRNERNWTKFKWTVDEIIITRWSHSNRKWVRYYVEWSSLVLSNTSCLHSDPLPIPPIPESKTIRFRIQWATITDLILQSLTHSRTHWSLIMDNSIVEFRKMSCLIDWLWVYSSTSYLMIISIHLFFIKIKFLIFPRTWTWRWIR